MKELGIIGFGSFSQFTIKHLKPFFDISVYSRRDISKHAEKIGVKVDSLENVASKEIVIIAIVAQYFEDLMKKIKSFVKPSALILDVCSVKMKPVEIMKKYLPNNVDILGTHPLFGPKSGKNGIKGMKIVLCPVRTKNLDKVKEFLIEKLGLQVLIKTPEEHDKEIAYVQGLTHFIGKTIKGLELPETVLKTTSYQHLLDLKELLKDDSEDLFLTIQKENPFAKKVREDFLTELKEINKEI